MNTRENYNAWRVSNTPGKQLILPSVLTLTMRPWIRYGDLKSCWQLAYPMPSPKPEPSETGHVRPRTEKCSEKHALAKKFFIYLTKEHLRLKRRTENTMPTPRPVTAKKKTKTEVWAMRLNYTFKQFDLSAEVIKSAPVWKQAVIDVNLL